MSDVSLAIVTRRNRYLLLLRSPLDQSNPNRWSIPGGHLEAGETPMEGMIRELREETGLVTKSLYCREIFVKPRPNGQGKIYFYHIWKTKGKVTLPDHEHVKSAWVPADAIELFEPFGDTLQLVKQIEKEKME